MTKKPERARKESRQRQVKGRKTSSSPAGNSRSTLGTEVPYQLLFTGMPLGLAYHRIVVDDRNRPVDYVFLDVNDAFEQFTGLKRAAIVGKRVTEAIPGIKKEKFDWIGTYGRVALTGQPTQFEQYFEPLRRWYSVSAYSPQKDYFVAAFRDITDWKRAEAALHESEEEYRHLYETAEVGLYRSRINDGKLLECNQKMAQMFGYESRELCLAEFVASEHYVDPHLREQMVARLKQTGEVKNFEAQVTRKDGSPIWVSYSGHAYPKEGHFEGTMVDITDRKRAEESVRQLSVSRALVGDMLQQVRTLSGGSEAVMFGLGEFLASRIKAQTIPEFLGAFADMGLGKLVLAEADKSERRWTFTGEGLVECQPGSSRPTGNLVRGFLCGALAQLVGAARMGAAEVACQSMGDEVCRFVVQVVR